MREVGRPRARAAAHTPSESNPSKKLAGAAAYVLPGIAIKNGKPVLAEN